MYNNLTKCFILNIQVGTLSIDSTDYQIKIGITKIGRHSSCDIVIRNGVSFNIFFIICTRN